MKCPLRTVQWASHLNEIKSRRSCFFFLVLNAKVASYSHVLIESPVQLCRQFNYPPRQAQPVRCWLWVPCSLWNLGIICFVGGWANCGWKYDVYLQEPESAHRVKQEQSKDALRLKQFVMQELQIIALCFKPFLTPNQSGLLHEKASDDHHLCLEKQSKNGTKIMDNLRLWGQFFYFAHSDFSEFPNFNTSILLWRLLMHFVRCKQNTHTS